jgi:hypothetical protein
MFNTINDSMSIYDSEVARMFSMSRPYQSEFKIKLDRYLHQLDKIQTTYEQIIEQNLLPKTSGLFDQEFKDNKLSEMKKLDFIFWSAGKIKALMAKEKENGIEDFDETAEQKVIADFNAVLQLRNLNYDRNQICEHLSIAENELSDLEFEYNRITGN